MAVNMKQGNMPHIFWIELKGDGVFVECAVMKKDQLGNVLFFELRALDQIDRRRLARILSNRNATHFELWDLMSNITLNNGVNALKYFHQLVKVITPSNRIMKPQTGVVGIEGTSGMIDTKAPDSRKVMEDAAGAAATAAANAAASAAADAIRNLQNPAPVQTPPPVQAPEQAPAKPATKEAAPAPTPAKRTTRKKTT